MTRYRNFARTRLHRAVCVWIVTGAAVVGPSLLVHGDGDALVNLLRNGPGVANHPVNVLPPPGMRIPDGWPLDASGAITCLTCHESIPAAGGGTVALRGFGDDMVDPIEFCARCHEGGDERSAAGMHWLALDRAHITGDDADGSAIGGIDAESRRCMECHDGVTAGEFANTTPWNQGAGSTGDHRREHPVGMAYPRSTPAGYSSAFRQAAMLPRRVRLPEGKVSCVSCHDLYSWEESLLTVPIRESALCLTCHDMD